MYRRQRTRPSLLILIIFAAIAGVIYFILDNTQDNSAPANDDTTITVTPDNIIAEATEDAQVTVVASATPLPDAIPLSEATPLPGSSDNTTSPNNIPVNPIPQDTALFIPSAGIYAPIVQTYLDGTSWDVSQLGTNVGHLQGTAWVDTPGNVVLSGHVELSDGRQGVFANLNEVVVGDIIVVVMNGDEWRYIVTEISSTTPEDLSPVYPTTDERLTLITCEDYDFISDAYLERTIIVAERMG
jgi:LPXTG-site transpeptidase (sortase) family protein